VANKLLPMLPIVASLAIETLTHSHSASAPSGTARVTDELL
jgi:hypothetical protein